MAVTRRAFANNIWCDAASDLPAAGQFVGQIAWINAAAAAVVKRWDGAAWVTVTPSFGGGFGTGRYGPWTTPPSGLDASSSDEFIGSINAGLFTWGNQGTATVTSEVDTLRFTTQASATRDRKCLWYTPPASDWVMSTAIAGDAFRNIVTGVGSGFCVLETGSIATPTLMSMELFDRAGPSLIEFGFYTSTSYTAALTLLGAVSQYSAPNIVGPPVFMQLRYVRSTKALNAWNGFDGINFAQVGTTRTLGAHPINIGLICDQNGANALANMRFHFLRTRTDATGTTSPFPVGA